MPYSPSQQNKIGNLLVYITSQLGATSKTKLLKLVYIIEEEYMKQAGVPLTELSFTHLPRGPVSTFILNQINKRRPLLGQFVNVEATPTHELYITPKVAFNDDEFSEFDLEVIDEVLTKFGHLNAPTLSDYTHREGSLWKKMQDQFNGPPPVEQNTFDMFRLLDDDDVDPVVREHANEHKAFVNYLTSNE